MRKTWVVRSTALCRKTWEIPSRDIRRSQTSGCGAALEPHEEMILACVVQMCRYSIGQGRSFHAHSMFGQKPSSHIHHFAFLIELAKRKCCGSQLVGNHRLSTGNGMSNRRRLCSYIDPEKIGVLEHIMTLARTHHSEFSHPYVLASSDLKYSDSPWMPL